MCFFRFVSSLLCDFENRLFRSRFYLGGGPVFVVMSGSGSKGHLGTMTLPSLHPKARRLGRLGCDGHCRGGPIIPQASTLGTVGSWVRSRWRGPQKEKSPGWEIWGEHGEHFFWTWRGWSKKFWSEGFFNVFLGRMLVFCLITLVMLLVIYLLFVVGRSNIIRGPIILSHS